jgi:hypothetical protein
MPIADNEIRLGYRFLLGREPESAEIYRLYRPFSFSEFRRTLVESPEGRKVLKGLMANGVPSERPRFERVVACFIHIEKTGGTTLHRVLEGLFPGDRLTPSHTSDLTGMTIDEIARYDAISGHFDYRSSQMIPASRVIRLSMFRDPVRRLVSFYRFHRAHPREARADNEFVALAHALPPERFFEQPALFSSPRTNNAYLRTFGTSHDEDPAAHMDADALAAAVDLARERIRTLDAVGVSERMGESIGLICRALERPPPPQVDWLHRTDELFRENPTFTRVEPVQITQPVLASLEPLVRYDRLLYAAVEAEFDRRLVSAR